MESVIGDIKGDTRSLDYGSYRHSSCRRLSDRRA